MLILLGWLFNYRRMRKTAAGDGTLSPLHARRAIEWAAVAVKLAHQIKTPLSTIHMAIEQMQDEYKQGAANHENFERYSGYAISELSKLRKLSEGLMRLAKLDELEKTTIDLQKLLENSVHEINQRKPSGVVLFLDYASNLTEISADANQIKMLFEILLNNALDAVGEKGRIRIMAKYEMDLQFANNAPLQKQVLLEIADDGCGIPAAEQNSVFEPFFKNKEGGTGIGLTIARKIVEDHGGKIWLQSEKGIGTSFFVALPAIE